MAGDVAPRHLWAVKLIAAESRHRVLEVGSGHGIATGLVASVLTSGHLTAVDRSAKMTAACLKRNAGAAGRGVLTCRTGIFEELDFPHRFDRAFAVNVDFPLHEERGWATKFNAVLRPGGLLVLVGEAPAPERAERFGADAGTALAAAGLDVELLREAGMVAVRAVRRPG